MSSDALIRQKPSRISTIVTHSACAEIEFACARGMSLRHIAERFGVSRAAVDWHWHGLPADHRARLAVLATDLDRYEARIREVYAALAVLAHVAPTGPTRITACVRRVRENARAA